MTSEDIKWEWTAQHFEGWTFPSGARLDSIRGLRIRYRPAGARRFKTFILILDELPSSEQITEAIAEREKGKT
jgi:hypothetical protein